MNEFYDEIDDTQDYLPPVHREYLVHLTEMELLRLHQVAMSSRLGLVDQGFPAIHARMEAKKVLEKVGPGWKITTFGLAALAERRNEVGK